MTPEANPGPTARTVEAATCLACGCLCDDIRLSAEGGRVVEAGRACPIGRGWFLAPRPGEGSPAATVDGEAAGFPEAVDRAAGILSRARSPVVWGLSRSSVEAVASAVALADAIGAVVDPSGPAGAEAIHRAFTRVGQVSATLGEVKSRADVVVFWGVDPVATHPRHFERYSVEPRGRFLPGGRLDRTVIVVDDRPTATAQLADLVVPVPRDRQAEALGALRALARGVRLDPDRVTRSAGIPFEGLEALASRLARARYGAFFFDAALGEGPLGPWAAEAALTLVRDLNDGRRFVALSLGSPGNGPGAGSVLSWQAGAPSGLDFGAGYPRHLPGEATLAARLEAGEVDAVLVVGEGPPPALLARLDSIPTVVIAPGATRPGPHPAVALDVARPGIESGGTVQRVDGVMLPLRPAIGAPVPTDREVLEALRRRMTDPLAIPPAG